MTTVGDTVRLAEAATLLGVSRPTVRRWVDRGLLEAWTTPTGERRIYVESIERVLAEGQSETAS